MNIVRYKSYINKKIINVNIIDYIFLNQDVMNHIMLYSEIYMIRKYIQTCKNARLLLHNNKFWQDKFIYDNLVIFNYLYFHIYPKDIMWIRAYMKSYKINIKLNHYMNFYNQYSYDKYPYSIRVRIPIDYDLSGLSINFNAKIKQALSLYYTLIMDESHAYISLNVVHNGPYIIYNVSDEYCNDYFFIHKNIKHEKYKWYLQKMLYFLQDFKFKII
jgi:hypothetical protein